MEDDERGMFMKVVRMPFLLSFEAEASRLFVGLTSVAPSPTEVLDRVPLLGRAVLPSSEAELWLFLIPKPLNVGGRV